MPMIRYTNNRISVEGEDPNHPMVLTICRAITSFVEAIKKIFSEM